MNTTLIAEKIGFNNNTLRAIVGDMMSEPSLRGRSLEELEDLLCEVLGVLTGDSPREEFPRTEVDRTVFRITRSHLEPQTPDGLTQRLAWASLWFGTRQLTVPV